VATRSTLVIAACVALVRRTASERERCRGPRSTRVVLEPQIERRGAEPGNGPQRVVREVERVTRDAVSTRIKGRWGIAAT
jgi:hypothetical protein